MNALPAVADSLSPEQLLQHLDQGRLWAVGVADFTDVAHAYQQALLVRQLRLDRGEQPRGFKIGFTNRNIWPRYNVYGPIWGTVWNTTLTFCEGHTSLPLTGLCQPRIEPEAVFGMASSPAVGATLDELFTSIDWVAPGFELVHTHRQDWKFTAADAVADSGLHGRLVVGTTC